MAADLNATEEQHKHMNIRPVKALKLDGLQFVQPLR
jgi:hypothetical protein